MVPNLQITEHLKLQKNQMVKHLILPLQTPQAEDAWQLLQ